MNKVQIKYHDTEIDKVQKITKGDWIDLRAAETVELTEEDLVLPAYSKKEGDIYREIYSKPIHGESQRKNIYHKKHNSDKYRRQD